MSNKPEKSKIPVIKSAGKNPLDSPRTAKPIAQPGIPTLSDSKSATGKIPVPSLMSKRNAASLIPSPLKTAKTNTVSCGSKKRSSNTPTAPKVGSYSEKYARKGTRQVQPKDQRVGLKREQQGILQHSPQEKREKTSKEKRVNFLKTPSTKKEEKEILKSESEEKSKMAIELNIDIKIKEPKSSMDVVGWICEDQINENGGVFLAQDLGFLVDPGVNQMEIPISKLQGNTSCPVFIERQVDSIEPISLFKTAGIEWKEPAYTSDDRNSEQSSQSEDEDILLYEAMEKEILSACGASFVSEGKKVEKLQDKSILKKVEKLQDKSILKKVAHVEKVQEMKKDKEKSQIKLDPKKPKNNVTFEKTDIIMKPEIEPNANWDYADSDQVEKFGNSYKKISVPSESSYEKNGTLATTKEIIKEKPATTDSGENENLIEAEETKEDKMSTNIVRKEICTGMQKEKEKLNKKEWELHKIRKSIAQGHQMLDEVEASMGWWKGVFLCLLLVTVAIAIIFLGWNIFKWHCDAKPEVKVEKSIMESFKDWLSSFFYSKSDDSAVETGSSWFSFPVEFKGR